MSDSSFEQQRALNSRASWYKFKGVTETAVGITTTVVNPILTGINVYEGSWGKALITAMGTVGGLIIDIHAFNTFQRSQAMGQEAAAIAVNRVVTEGAMTVDEVEAAMSQPLPQLGIKVVESNQQT